MARYSRKKRRRRKILVGVLATVLCIWVVVIVVAVAGTLKGLLSRPSVSGEEDSSSAAPEITTQPTDPPGPQPVATATIGSSGDILIHKPVLRSAKQDDGSYDFTSMFQFIKPYASGMDYAAINVELAITDSGFDTAEMIFRVPSTLIDAVAGAGYDLGLLANNHIGNGGKAGYKTTLEALANANMDAVGLRGSTSDKRYLIKDVNGIKLGIVNYTYGTETNAGSVLNTFSVKALDSFYTDMEGQIRDMKADGAEAIILYIHWGNEYFVEPNSSQEAIANKMCELGVDVIIGGHPHKIQPVELITAENGNQTVCLYSMGNILSNQVIESMYGGSRSHGGHYQDHVNCPIRDVTNRYKDEKWNEHISDCNDNGHTEDGLLFQTTFTKYDDGTVLLTGVEVLPTWCYRNPALGSSYEYTIIPLDKSVEDWGSAFGIEEKDLVFAQRSYDRTMALVSEGINACNQAIQAKLDEMKK